MAKTQKTRIIWIDYLETIAIFLVVFYHCTSHIATHLVSEANGWFFFYYFLRSIAAICVPLFFFANGFLLLRHEFNLKKHLLKILKFFLVTLFWYAVTLAFMVFLHRAEIAASGLSAVLSSVKYSINHLWYLGALVCLYLFFPLLKAVYDHHRQIFLYFTLVCAILVFGNSLLNHLATFTAQFFLHQDTIFSGTNFLSIFNPLRGVYGYVLVFFCLGGVVNYYLEKITSISPKKRNFFAIAGLVFSQFGLFVLGLLYSKASGHIWDNVFNCYDTVFTLLGTISVFLLCLNFTHGCRLIELISRNTLGIYLVHMLIILGFSFYFNNFVMRYLNPLSQSVPYIIIICAIIIYTVAITLISLGISLIIKKIPFLRKSLS